MTPVHTVKGAKRYRYYATTNTEGSKIRLAALDLEQAVIAAIASWLRNFSNISTLQDPLGTISSFERSKALAGLLEGRDDDASMVVRQLIKRTEYHHERLVIELDKCALLDRLGMQKPDQADLDTITIEQSCSCARRARVQRLVIGDATVQEPHIDRALVKAIVRARSWFECLKTRQLASIADLARREELPRAWISQQLPLAFLAPDIVETVASGRQPSSWTIDRLLAAASCSPDWAVQRTALG
jgi:site-specific DNA recombinase